MKWGSVIGRRAALPVGRKQLDSVGVRKNISSQKLRQLLLGGLQKGSKMRFAQLLLKNGSLAGIPKQVERFSKFSPSPLSMKQFIDFGKRWLVLCSLYVQYCYITHVTYCLCCWVCRSCSHSCTWLFNQCSCHLHNLWDCVQKHVERFVATFVFFKKSLNGVFVPHVTAGSANACEKTSFVFLRQELPVRLANIMKEIDYLPDKLLSTPSVKLLTSW